MLKCTCRWYLYSRYDSGHVCLFELELKSYWFDEFNFDGTPLRLGIHCELMIKINCKEEHQTISLKTTTGDKLFVTLSFLEKDKWLQNSLNS